MNWAMPCAPAGLTTRGLKPLSCQIRLAKNGAGRPLARATETMALHRPAREIGRAGSAGRLRRSTLPGRASSRNSPSSVSAMRAITASGSGVDRMAGRVGERCRVRRKIGRGQQLRGSNSANECANDQRTIELHAPTPRRPSGRPVPVCLFCVAVWMSPGRAPHSCWSIRDDIVETTRVMASSRREMRAATESSTKRRAEKSSRFHWKNSARCE